MYCASCGSALARDLGYCNHCGARLGGARGESSTLPESLMWAIVGVFAIGVGSTIGLIAVMKNYGFNEGLISAFAVSIFALMLVIEAVFIGLLWSRNGLGKEVSGAYRPKEQTTSELDQATPRALAEPLASVTEHTTRAFEPVNRERKAE